MRAGKVRNRESNPAPGKEASNLNRLHTAVTAPRDSRSPKALSKKVSAPLRGARKRSARRSAGVIGNDALRRIKINVPHEMRKAPLRLPPVPYSEIGTRIVVMPPQKRRRVADDEHSCHSGPEIVKDYGWRILAAEIFQ